MGLLRLYLALCVVAGHSSALLPWKMHDGRQAVEIFYMISGFYMSLVLSTKYNSRSSFYASRALRIFVPYGAALAFTLLVCLGARLLFSNALRLEPFFARPLEQNGALGFFLAALSNLTIIGQDWVMFLSQHAGEGLRLTTDFQQDAN